MAEKAVFYHAGCSVCADAEQRLSGALDKSLYHVKVAHFGEKKGRIHESKQAGVKSVPALVIAGSVYHVNHGADLLVLR